jgi:hypothetical protein
MSKTDKDKPRRLMTQEEIDIFWQTSRNFLRNSGRKEARVRKEIKRRAVRRARRLGLDNKIATREAHDSINHNVWLY